ncbi:hypothetical protein [Sphingomonas parva]|nr:hypothetical protein [Sphingomonas parva]
MDVHPILLWLARAAAEARRPRSGAILLSPSGKGARDAARR